MMRSRTYLTATTAALMALLIVHGGCTTFQPLDPGTGPADPDPKSQRIRIVTADGVQFQFPAGQYRFDRRTDSLWTCDGWGEKYGSFGLMGVGFYSVSDGPGTVIEVARIDAVRSVIVTGIISGATVGAYLGIRHLSSSSDKGGGGGRPPEVN